MRQHRRFEFILDRIAESGFVTIDELTSSLEVTPQTIRRDVSQLESEGQVKRYHGGVGAAENSTTNSSYQTRKSVNSDAKQTIAKLVADYIPDGASLFINIGTTTEAVAEALLSKQNLTVVTNNLNVAVTLSSKSDFTVIVAGGEVRNSDGGIVGSPATDLINSFQMEYAIIGISGIQPDGTLLDYDLREVRVSQAIIANASEVLLCSDNSKFGRTPMVKLGHIQDISRLFTNDCPDDQFTNLLIQNDVIIHCPGNNPVSNRQLSE